MSHVKIKGKAWCSNCAQNQPSVLTRLVQREDGYEVQGYCLTCEGFVSRDYGSNAKEEEEDTSQEIATEKPPEEVAAVSQVIVSPVREEEKKSPIVVPEHRSQPSQRPFLLRALFVSLCMLVVDQFI